MLRVFCQPDRGLSGVDCGLGWFCFGRIYPNPKVRPTNKHIIRAARATPSCAGIGVLTVIGGLTHDGFTYKRQALILPYTRTTSAEQLENVEDPQ
jgi:hypothetical protein